jgi:hypothetical protein
MEFIDFQLRAWQADADHILVLVHSSPAGCMERPFRATAHLAQLDVARCRFGGMSAYDQFTLGQIFDLGKRLADALLPPPVQTLLERSLARIASGDGLRLRLCLDEALNDLPWEFLYGPDRAAGSLAGFLALDPRISIVRRSPTLIQTVKPSDDTLRMVFFGALWSDGDHWMAKQEYERLRQVLAPVAALVQVDPFRPASGLSIETALSNPAAIFHYVGHTECDGERGYLVREVVSRDRHDFDRMYSDQLAALLYRASVKLALFSACNSGYRAFAGPLLAADLPALVGVQGVVTNVAAERFCDVLYRFLAAGLSLDEAVTTARAALVTHIDPDERGSFDWGRFMVYLTAHNAVLLPRPASLAASKEVAHQERDLIIKVAGDLVLGSKVRKQIDTGGGLYIGRDALAAGDVIGRDQIITGDASPHDLEP